MSDKGRNSNIVTNRKAKFEYHFLEEFEAGIVLTGTEVKSLRNGKASLQEAYCFIDSKEELLISGMNIAQYDKGSYNNHEPMRVRKLLLKKKDIRKLKSKLDEKGLTLVPYRLYFGDRNYVKLQIALAKGKKIHDKRDSIKDKDTRRDMQRVMKEIS
jgi:SsrA-binding protein